MSCGLNYNSKCNIHVSSTDALIKPLGVYLQLFTDYWEREVAGHTFVMAGDWDLQSASLYQTFRSGLNGSPAAAVSHVGFTSVALSGHAVGPQCLWSIHKQPWPPYSDQPLWPAERDQSETPVRPSGRHQAFRDCTCDFMTVVAVASRSPGSLGWIKGRHRIPPCFYFAFLFLFVEGKHLQDIKVQNTVMTLKISLKKKVHTKYLKTNEDKLWTDIPASSWFNEWRN